MNFSPEQIFEEYKKGVAFKSSIGAKGLYEQSRVNERFFVGDQWYGSKCGNDRPLVRHNIIKRIGDYKMSAILSNKIEINYSADGVPNTLNMRKSVKQKRKELSENPVSFTGKRDDNEISLMMSALNDYQKVTAERVGFNGIAEQALRDAYISGTAVVYTYWNPQVSTGLYADDYHTTAIKGDIECETLSIENVYFGDPYISDIQQQPFIIIATRSDVASVKREATYYGKTAELDFIKPDNNADDDGKVTVLTRLWKEWDEDGNFSIFAQKVTADAVIRDKWNIGVRLYPLAQFCWERRKNCAYGDSEITYLIPNQIAINRMITSGVWSTMSTGMPSMVVNGDVVDGEITNDPGQIIKVFGSGEDVANAVRYVTPPDNSANFYGVIEPFINNTLAQNGAGAAALGDVDPNNTSAIIELKNAARMPLQLFENRYFAFLEEISRIWAEFWITQYGNRRIKIIDENGIWYLNFDGDRYKDLLISVKAQVSTKNTSGEARVYDILDKLLDKGAITPKQYLKWLPAGTLESVTKLIGEMEENENDRT